MIVLQNQPSIAQGISRCKGPRDALCLAKLPSSTDTKWDALMGQVELHPQKKRNWLESPVWNHLWSLIYHPVVFISITWAKNKMSVPAITWERPENLGPRTTKRSGLWGKKNQNKEPISLEVKSFRVFNRNVWKATITVCSRDLNPWLGWSAQDHKGLLKSKGFRLTEKSAQRDSN